MGNTSKPQTSASVSKTSSHEMSHVYKRDIFVNRPDMHVTKYSHSTRTRLFQLGSCQTQDAVQNSCVMDDTQLQGDKIIKIAGGFTHLAILTGT
jgi:hypothetical protein